MLRRTHPGWSGGARTTAAVEGSRTTSDRSEDVDQGETAVESTRDSPSLANRPQHEWGAPTPLESKTSEKPGRSRTSRWREVRRTIRRGGGADRASAEAAVGFLQATTDPVRDNPPSRSRVSSPAKLPITIDTISMGFSLKCLLVQREDLRVEMLPDRFCFLARLDTTDARDEVRKDTRRRDAGDWGVWRGPPVDRLRVRRRRRRRVSVSLFLLQTLPSFPTTSSRPDLPASYLASRSRRRLKNCASARARATTRPTDRHAPKTRRLSTKAGQGAERGGRGGVLRGQRRRGRPKARGRPAGRREQWPEPCSECTKLFYRELDSSMRKTSRAYFAWVSRILSAAPLEEGKPGGGGRRSTRRPCRARRARAAERIADIFGGDGVSTLSPRGGDGFTVPDVQMDLHTEARECLHWIELNCGRCERF